MKNVILKVRTWWNNQSVSHKLYAVVGVMAALIAIELFTLLFAMNTLSAVRAFVGGEGIWSKAQKGAVLELQNYAWTHDESHYQAFLQHLKVPMGDHDARMEMLKPNMNMDEVRRGFLAGGVHPQDIMPMVTLIRRFHTNKYISKALQIWGQADERMLELIDISADLRKAIDNKYDPRQKKVIKGLLDQIFVINNELTDLEIDFSSTLGEASRWLEHSLMILLIIAVATVECTGLLLTTIFSRGLARSLNELHWFAIEVGSGQFNQRVPVRTGDELGQLASALNHMAGELKDMNSDKQIAERANEVKNLFLANMSHEIRTPLNAILGFVELLKDPNLSAKDRNKFVAIVERTGTSLATIINDILDISKVEAGKLEIVRAPCNLDQVLDDVESVLRIRCEEKGIRLRFARSPYKECVVTDATRYKQILLNVIGNAIKFTTKGEVVVTFEKFGSKVHCTVADTGIGISPDNVDKLFQPFSQLDLSIRKEFGGTGLGLTLSRRLARLLGGDVKLASSRPGMGSVFEISIMVEPAGSVAKMRAKKILPSETYDNALNGLRILLVEDSVDNQLLALHLLEKEGALVKIANHGQEAIEMVGREDFEVILMDMQMPVLDGYSATANLRRSGLQIPIIGLTAHAMKEDLDKCLDAGCNDYLCKPYKKGDLISIILEHSASAA